MTTRRPRLTASRLTAVTLPVAAASAVVRAVAARGNDSLAVREAAVATAATCAAIAVIPPAAVSRLASWSREPNAGPLVAQLATATAASYGTAVLQRGLYPERIAVRKVHTWRSYLHWTTVGMMGLFLLDRTTVAELREPSDRLFESKASAGYWVLFGGHMAMTSAEIARLGSRSSRLAGATGATRTGVQMMRVGGVAMSCLYSQLVVGVLGKQASDRFPRPARGLGVLAAVTGSGVVIVAGASVAGTLLRMRRSAQILSDTATLILLRRPWKLLIATDTTKHVPVAGGLGSSDVRLQRRVIEMLDALDRLAATHDPAGSATALASQVVQTHGLAQADALPLIRAALVVLGLAKPGTNDEAARAPMAEADDDFRQEAGRLLKTGKYLRTSTLPAVLAERLTRTADLYRSGRSEQGQPSKGLSMLFGVSAEACAAIVAASTQPAGCTCANDAWAPIARYGMERAAFEEFMIELQQGCPQHGER